MTRWRTRSPLRSSKATQPRRRCAPPPLERRLLVSALSASWPRGPPRGDPSMHRRGLALLVSTAALAACVDDVGVDADGPEYPGEQRPGHDPGRPRTCGTLELDVA